MQPHHIAVEQCRRASPFVQQRRQALGGRRLPAPLRPVNHTAQPLTLLPLAVAELGHGKTPTLIDDAHDWAGMRRPVRHYLWTRPAA